MMVDEENNKALIKRSENGLATIGKQTTNIMSRMTGAWLAVAKSSHAIAESKRFRIGEYEFRKPDYDQIRIWASDLNLTPEDVLARLRARAFRDPCMEFEFSVVDGAIRSLVLDIEELRLSAFDWVIGLEIERLAITRGGGMDPISGGIWAREITFLLDKVRLENNGPNREAGPLNTPFPKLTALFCDNCGLTGIDVSGSPSISILSRRCLCSLYAG